MIVVHECKGWDEGEGRPRLMWFDRIGAMKEVSRACHGAEFMLVLSLLDRKRLECNSGIGEGTKKLEECDPIELEAGEDAARAIVDECWQCIDKRGVESSGQRHMFMITSEGVISSPKP